MGSATPTATAPADHGPATPTVTARLATAANQPVPADSAAVFRIVFGVLVAVSSTRFLARGWVDTLYLEPAHHLGYVGLEWVRPLPAPWMHLVVAGLAATGICIAAGWHTRAAAVCFTIGFAYVESIDAALYLNHYWYLTLTGVLLVLLPVGHHWSLDARRGRVRPSATVPVGVIWVLRAQLGIVYLFAGIAKLQGDWLLRAEPMGTWLADRTGVPVVGPVLAVPAVAYVFSWAGAFFDCTIVGWLLWRRTRIYAYGAVVAFHLATAMLFQIGMFPWVMIASTPIFFEPDWPRSVTRRLRPESARPSSENGPHDRYRASGGPRLGRVVVVTLVVLAVIEVFLPLRHLLVPGDVRWNEGGYYGSWRVMLTEKGGFARFMVTDPRTGRSWEEDPGLVLTDWQTAQASVRPDLLLETAHLIAQHYRNTRGLEVEVRADARVSMNGRPARPIADPRVDLAAVPRTDPPWWVPD